MDLYFAGCWLICLWVCLLFCFICGVGICYLLISLCFILIVLNHCVVLLLTPVRFGWGIWCLLVCAILVWLSCELCGLFEFGELLLACLFGFAACYLLSVL